MRKIFLLLGLLGTLKADNRLSPAQINNKGIATTTYQDFYKPWYYGFKNSWEVAPRKPKKHNVFIDFAKKYLDIMEYRGTYFLPMYYSFTPIYQWYHPDINRYQPVDFKFQISFKVPVIRNFLYTRGTLYLAYTQTNWFQIYNNPQSAPMRMVNYMPELIYIYPLKIPFFTEKLGNFTEFWIGWQHISNGIGGRQCFQPYRDGNALGPFPGTPVHITEEDKQVIVQAGGLDGGCRSVSAGQRPVFHLVWQKGGLKLNVAYWPYIPYNQSNPNLIDYMGYGNAWLEYRRGRHHFEMRIYDLFTRYWEFKDWHGAIRLGYTFRINRFVGFYMQYFNGYGDGLYEYDVFSNRFGVGIRLNP
ncbi:phospholipase A [Helicobacter ailurogastricus]|uniref:phospholipase A n=1 Tax=Helicobacter ailurogastricus TaxID=1578720 RepID=UPI0022C5B402|nr:phospholipase A [Helicobacter ailurogastricus]GLH57301.1 Phospholipase A1 [Helicobacter ailurogastricus]GLH59552.1 Phospholipase A1 [Helicobacter ailurogastricus]